MQRITAHATHDRASEAREQWLQELRETHPDASVIFTSADLQAHRYDYVAQITCRSDGGWVLTVTKNEKNT